MKRIEAGIIKAMERRMFADTQLAREAKKKQFKSVTHGPYYDGGPVLVTIYYPASHGWNLDGRKVETHTITKEIYDSIE
jgi:hypothetical protein